MYAQHPTGMPGRWPLRRPHWKRIGQTGRAPRASQGAGAVPDGVGSQGRRHSGGSLGSGSKEEEGLVCKVQGSFCWQNPRLRQGGRDAAPVMRGWELVGSPGGV